MSWSRLGFPAADRCNDEGRKTITPEDILWSMGQLGFDEYEMIMKICLVKTKDVGCLSCFVLSSSCSNQLNRVAFQGTGSGEAGESSRARETSD